MKSLLLSLQTSLLVAAGVVLGETTLRAAASTTTNSLGMELAAIPAGSFVMGDDKDGDWDERPAHKVIISRPFQISVSEVTLEQYRQFRLRHDCAFNGKVTGVSWNDASAFCDWLSKREGKPYRLPTEAEWEYACRAGSRARFWSGDAPPANDAVPNPWELKGTHDAVMEWCRDWHGPYSAREQVDPVGPAEGLAKVVRGDKPDSDERLKDEKDRQPSDYHRSANRAGMPPSFGVPVTSAEAAQKKSDVAATPGASGADNTGCHRIGFRVVQAELPSTPRLAAFVPFVRQCVKRPIEQIRQAPDKPYFCKRYLLPIPPDNSPDEAIAAAGLHPSFRNHNHSPALEVCPNGDLLLIIYTSRREYEPGVSLMASRLRYGTDQWEMPEPIFDLPDVNDHAPLLWTDWERKQIYFFWGCPKLANGAFPFQWMTSGDSGATWSEVQFPVFTGQVGPHSRQPINTALRAADGTLYVASDAEGGSSVLWATKDEGRTWHDTGGRSAGRHTTCCLLRDGAILGMGGKSTDIDGYMPRVISRDRGKTWEKSKTPFAALGVNQRPSILRLGSGRLFFAGDFQKRGGIAPKEITERGSYVAFSEDEGETWRIKKLPGAQPHERPDLQNEAPTIGYSVARQSPNGMIHLITSMNNPCLHFEFNEAWLLSDAATSGSDSELMQSRATRIGKVETFKEKFSDGSVKSRWNGGVADDDRFLLHGAEKCYYENGKPHYEATYNLGRKSGSETLWRPDGTIVWRWEHNSNASGVWTQFWENGKKKAESRWRDFMADGKACRWDRAGKLVSEVQFVKGIVR